MELYKPVVGVRKAPMTTGYVEYNTESETIVGDTPTTAAVIAVK